MGTGTATSGNYSAETLRGRSTNDFARRTRQRIAYVSNHPRQREHVWNLVAKALRNLRYGGDWLATEISGATEELPEAVRKLVNAARQVAYAEHGSEAYDEISKALQPFAHLVAWEDVQITSDLEQRCTAIADQAVPAYRNGDRSYDCTGHTAKRWQAAWDGACIALGGNHESFKA